DGAGDSGQRRSWQTPVDAQDSDVRGGVAARQSSGAGGSTGRKQRKLNIGLERIAGGDDGASGKDTAAGDQAALGADADRGTARSFGELRELVRQGQEWGG